MLLRKKSRDVFSRTAGRNQNVMRVDRIQSRSLQEERNWARISDCLRKTTIEYIFQLLTNIRRYHGVSAGSQENNRISSLSTVIHYGVIIKNSNSYPRGQYEEGFLAVSHE